MKRKILSLSFFGFMIILILWHFYNNIYPQYKYLLSLPETASLYPVSAYNLWLGMDVYSLQTKVYYLLFPLWGILSYTIVKGHYDFCKKKVLFFGGIGTIFPLLVDLAIVFMFLPAIKPEAIVKYSTISDASLFSSLFYSHPLLYTILYLAIDYFYAELFFLLFYYSIKQNSLIYSAVKVYLIYGVIIGFEFALDIEADGLFYFLMPGQPYNNQNITCMTIHGVILCVLILIQKLITNIQLRRTQ